MKGKLSVLISVYCKELPEFLHAALDSIVNQTLLPLEIILVEDGPLTTALNLVITEYCSVYPSLFKIVKLEKNVGLGIALNKGLEYCTQDIVIRMDSDDICTTSRFEELYNYLENNPTVSVVGSTIEEFRLVPGDTKTVRDLPSDFDTIKKFAKFRNPLNHPSVAFRKNDIIKAGGYLDMSLFEDYYLWVRLIIAGYRIANINKSLLHFRIGNNMLGRRHGLSYLQKELKFLKAIRDLNFISNVEYLTSLFLKLPLRVMPRKILQVIYKTFLR